MIDIEKKIEKDSHGWEDRDSKRILDCQRIEKVYVANRGIDLDRDVGIQKDRGDRKDRKGFMLIRR